MQESSRGADHGSDLRLHVSLYAGNCSEHVCTVLIEYRSGGTPGFHTFFGRVTELRAVDEGAVPASAPATSRLFVLPVAARHWVSIDNTFWHARWPTQRVGLLHCSQMDLIGFCHSLSHMLGKYFLRCWPLTATGNLTPSNSSSMYAFPGKT